jgi:hypothetical protein
MSVILKTPVNTVSLDRIRIASIKIEYNPSIGQLWTEYWLTIGKLLVPDDQTTFKQYYDQQTGAEVFAYLKIEDGMNPFRPGMALGKCAECGKWFNAISGACDVDGCGGIINPYDGWTRMASVIVPEGTIFNAISTSSYAFLAAEEVPDPDTWELKYLIDVEL